MVHGKEIFNIQKMAHALRHTEYKDIVSAANEIVDNSVEANASVIKIIADTYLNRRTGKNEINDIAFLDNGSGMNFETLHNCLVYGESTRTKREGIGRFGVGLAQASLFAAPRVEVYSWSNSGEIKYVYLDTKLMANGQQEVINPPVTIKIPAKYRKHITENMTNSGTLVRWVKVDKSPVKQVQSLFYRFGDILSETYRYYIQDGLQLQLVDNSHGGRVDKLKAIDPMFLMEKDQYLANSTNLGIKAPSAKYGEPIFELFNHEDLEDGVYNIEVPYLNGVFFEKKSYVKIRFSVVKEKFYYDASRFMKLASPGATPIGKYVRKYEGISILRAQRQVDFGKFGFYDSINTPTNRWWSIEVLFTPVLDEVFKISNNKQHVELKKPTKRELENIDEFNIWVSLNEVIDKFKKAMLARNRKLASKVPETATKPEFDTDEPKSSGSNKPVAKEKIPVTTTPIDPPDMDEILGGDPVERIKFEPLTNKSIDIVSTKGKKCIKFNSSEKEIQMLELLIENNAFLNDFLNAFSDLAGELFSGTGYSTLKRFLDTINSRKRGE